MASSKSMMSVLRSVSSTLNRASSTLAKQQVYIQPAAQSYKIENNVIYNYPLITPVESEQTIVTEKVEFNPAKLQFIELLNEVPAAEESDGQVVYECMYKKKAKARMKRIKRKKGNKICVRFK